ncbi:MAG: NAD(P)/FAD-dependent oxidoreductase [Candidatus Omnitrophota bacterium]
MNKIVVIGAGPSGMMAAIRSSQLASEVALIEKNPVLGKKLLLCGKGRCNLTNACDLDSFLQRFFGNGEFLRDAFGKFFNKELMSFFEQRGLKLKVERQLRVFPVTDRSNSVLEILKKELIKNKVKIIYNGVVKDILIKDGKVSGVLLKEKDISNLSSCGSPRGEAEGLTAGSHRMTEGFIPADRVILATGGVSYSFTGSTGEGIDIARKTGHRIVVLRSGLVPLEVRGNYPKKLEGLALKNIRFKISSSKKHFYSEIGELMWTANGISGPLIISLSAKIGDWLQKDKHLYIGIDLKPALSYEQLDSRLLREFKANPRMILKNILKELLPQRLIDVFLQISKINPDKQASHITQEERKNIISLFKEFRMEISGLAPIEQAMVTRGGVSLKDINPRTMESRIIKGLYFAGEVIDIAADTGGFNLQAAFSTGYLAGESAALN